MVSRFADPPDTVTAPLTGRAAAAEGVACRFERIAADLDAREGCDLIADLFREIADHARYLMARDLTPPPPQ